MQANTFDVISKRKECVYKPTGVQRSGQGLMLEKGKGYLLASLSGGFLPTGTTPSSLGDRAARKRQIELRGQQFFGRTYADQYFGRDREAQAHHIFQARKLWVFKQFFDNHELFNALQYYYNKDLYRFEFKSAKYAPILKNSVAFKETASERIFLMKDLAAVEEAVGLGAKIVESEVAFD